MVANRSHDDILTIHVGATSRTPMYGGHRSRGSSRAAARGRLSSAIGGTRCVRAPVRVVGLEHDLDETPARADEVELGSIAVRLAAGRGSVSRHDDLVEGVGVTVFRPPRDVGWAADYAWPRSERPRADPH